MTIVIEGLRFDTVDDAAVALNTTMDVIFDLCNNPDWSNCYIESDDSIEMKPPSLRSIESLRFSKPIINIRKTEDKRRGRYARRVVIRGTEYESVKEATKYIDATIQEVTKRCNDNERTDYQWIEETVEERFWSQVNIKNKNDCWEWQGGMGMYGYGQFSIKGPKPAHRVAWEITYGDLPEGAHVRHAICDNRKCVNPNHLSLGTPKENMYDKDKYLLIPFPPEESIQFPTDIKDRSRDWLFVGSTKRQKITRACNAIMHN